jgi:hypothetical protein
MPFPLREDETLNLAGTLALQYLTSERPTIRHLSHSNASGKAAQIGFRVLHPCLPMDLKITALEGKRRCRIPLRVVITRSHYA